MSWCAGRLRLAALALAVVVACRDAPTPEAGEFVVQAPADSGDTAPAPRTDAFGLESARADALARRANAGPADLRALAPAAEALQFDPLSARYLDAIRSPKIEGRPTDGGLDEAELAALRTYGFVVTERLANATYGDAFAEIYVRDQPVFVSADAILHPWHRSFDTALESIERASLVPRLGRVLVAASAALPGIGAELPEGSPLRGSVDDAEVLLGVARALLDDAPVTSARGQEVRIAELVAAVRAEALVEVPLFGRPRTEDFSQYRPRGHYSDDPTLARYFRAAMWLGRVDLRVGTVTLALSVLGGRVTRAHVVASTVSGDELATCFVRVIRTLRVATDEAEIEALPIVFGLEDLLDDALGEAPG